MKIPLILSFILTVFYPALSQNNYSAGVVNERNQVVIPFIYNYIYYKNGNLIYVDKDSKGGVIDTSGHEIVPCEYDDVQLFPYAIKVRKDKYSGMLHRDGLVSIPCLYDKIEEKTYPENFVLATKGSREGLIDSSGREIVSFIYDRVGFLSEDLVTVCKDGFCGIIDRLGQVKIPFMYESIGIFKSDNALARMNGKWGMINKRNEIVFPFLYDQCGEILTRLHNRVFLFRKDKHWGLVDSVGNVLVPFQYENLECSLDGVLVGRKADKFGMLDFSGKAITPMKYDLIGTAYIFKHGYTPVIIGNKWGMVNQAGKETIPVVFDYLSSVSSNCFIAQNELKQYGLIDSLRKVLAPFQYDIIERDSENRICALRNDKWGYLDESGKIAVPFIYDMIWSFQDGYAVVQKGSKRGVIDIIGKTIIPFIYEDVGYLGDRLFKCSIKKITKN